MMRDAKQNDIILPSLHEAAHKRHTGSTTTSHMHTKGDPSGFALPLAALNNIY